MLRDTFSMIDSINEDEEDEMKDEDDKNEDEDIVDVNDGVNLDSDENVVSEKTTYHTAEKSIGESKEVEMKTVDDIFEVDDELKNGIADEAKICQSDVDLKSDDIVKVSDQEKKADKVEVLVLSKDKKIFEGLDLLGEVMDLNLDDLNKPVNAVDVPNQNAVDDTIIKVDNVNLEASCVDLSTDKVVDESIKKVVDVSNDKVVDDGDKDKLVDNAENIGEKIGCVKLGSNESVLSVEDETVCLTQWWKEIDKTVIDQIDHEIEEYNKKKANQKKIYFLPSGKVVTLPRPKCTDEVPSFILLSQDDRSSPTDVGRQMVPSQNLGELSNERSVEAPLERRKVTPFTVLKSPYINKKICVSDRLTGSEYALSNRIFAAIGDRM